MELSPTGGVFLPLEQRAGVVSPVAPAARAATTHPFQRHLATGESEPDLRSGVREHLHAGADNCSAAASDFLCFEGLLQFAHQAAVT